MFLAVQVLSLVNCPIWPDLITLSLLHVIDPMANELCSETVVIGAIAVSHVVFPLSFVYVPVFQGQFPFSACLVLFPLPRELAPVWPDLLSLTVPLPIQPPAFVANPISKFDHWQFDTCLFIDRVFGLVFQLLLNLRIFKHKYFLII